MAVNIYIRRQLPYDTILLDNQAYDNSIIGITFDGRAIYCYESMVEELVEEGFEELDAIEWIEYNTIRALPYFGTKAPLIVYKDSCY